MSDTAGSGGAEDAPTESPVDQKAAFKAALDKKRAAENIRAQHLDGDNHVSGSSHAAAAKRQFRRKSG